MREPALRALIVGGGIGGLAAAVALKRVGIEATVFERAPRIGEVGAGLSLWSNAVIALRRLGVEAQVLAAGSPVGMARTFLAGGKPTGEFDLAGLAEKAGAVSLCIHRAALQRILLEAAAGGEPDPVRTGRDCVGFAAEAGGIVARFADGSTEQGDVLIGADGIHSAVRRQLFGAQEPRAAGYFAWRGIAVAGAGDLLPEAEAMLVLGRGSQAGCFHCGGGAVYWFLTCNLPPGSRPGAQTDSAQANRAGANRAAALAIVAEWRLPVRRFIEATEEPAILRNDIVDRPPHRAWGAGPVTLLGDAIHATTPNLGQGACQALEDAVVLADALSRGASPEAGLRDYEARRRDRTRFVIEQSWRLGRMAQTANPIGIWLRDALGSTAFARRSSERLFERLLCADLPELHPQH